MLAEVREHSGGNCGEHCDVVRTSTQMLAHLGLHFTGALHPGEGSNVSRSARALGWELWQTLTCLASFPFSLIPSTTGGLQLFDFLLEGAKIEYRDDVGFSRSDRPLFASEKLR